MFTPEQKKHFWSLKNNTHTTLSFWRSGSLLKFNATRSCSRALNHCVQCRLLAKPTKITKSTHYTQTVRTALSSKLWTAFMHDLPEQCASATHTHNHCHCQTVGFSLQYAVWKEERVKKRANKERKIAGLFCWSRIQRVRGQTIFIVMWAAVEKGGRRKIRKRDGLIEIEDCEKKKK